MQESESERPYLLPALLLALASGGWAAFLWQQLLVSRSGGDPYCALGGDQCASLWDGPLASWVHAATGVPVAGWGLVWSLAAALVVMLAWARPTGPFRAGLQWIALAGAGSVIGLLVASAVEGGFCGSCTITYLLVLAFAGVIGWGLGVLPAFSGPALGSAALATAVAYGALLWPGLRTPRGDEMPEASVLAAPAETAPGRVADAETLRSGGFARLAALPEPERLRIRQSLEAWRKAPTIPPEKPRAVLGSPVAPVRVTAFTDSGCGHCARFHSGLERLLASVPEGSVSFESRHFPLDGSCNPHIGGTGQPGRCVAARARLCLDGDPHHFAFETRVYQNGGRLEREAILELAEPFIDRAQLERCLADEATEAALLEDVELARRHGIRGTPMVLVNDRRVPTDLSFLYAFALAGGDADHAFFAGLPEPVSQPGAPDPEADHAHRH